MNEPLKRMFRRRSDELVKRSLASDVEGAARWAVDFEYWFLAMMKSTRKQGYDMGYEEGRKDEKKQAQRDGGIG